MKDERVRNTAGWYRVTRIYDMLQMPRTHFQCLFGKMSLFMFKDVYEDRVMTTTLTFRGKYATTRVN